jgi:hypothetical protein
MTYWFRPANHWNVITEAVFDCLLRAGYGREMLTMTGNGRPPQ